jgi:hypothetical protein
MFVYDPECEMPAAIQERNAKLNDAARFWYLKRNQAEGAQDFDKAQDYQVEGDALLAQAIALTEEWS